MDGESGWVLQAVVSRAAFRRVPPNGKSYFTLMSLLTDNHFSKKRGIAKHVLFGVRSVVCRERVDTVSGDFNGAAWRKKSGDDKQRDNTIEEAFAHTNLPIPHGSSALWCARNVPGEWVDVCEIHQAAEH